MTSHGCGRAIAVQRRGVVAGCVWLALTSCAGSQTEVEAGGDGGSVTRRDNRILHEPCDLSDSGAKGTDVNGDGQADITVVLDGGKEVCRAVDLNFDGQIDTFVYTDGQGKVRRRESDYDRDGRVDEISIYQGGVIAQKLRATTQAGKLDTWHFYEGGKLARTERDSNLDTVVDQWWEYKQARLECPLIHSDVDGDGRPDPGATVDVCGEESGYVPPERSQGHESTSTFERTQGGVPTEVDEGGAPSEASGADEPADGAESGGEPSGGAEEPAPGETE